MILTITARTTAGRVRTLPTHTTQGINRLLNVGFKIVSARRHEWEQAKIQQRNYTISSYHVRPTDTFAVIQTGILISYDP